MKKTFILIILGFFTMTTFSQTEKKIIGVSKQYNTPDTTNTFCFLNKLNYDNSIDSLIKYWGTPVKNSVGVINWTGIDIPNIGINLNISLTDRICTMVKGDMMCLCFKDKEDKELKLKELKSNQFRDVEITITDNNGKNIIDNSAKTEIVKKLLEKIVD